MNDLIGSLNALAAQLPGLYTLLATILGLVSAVLFVTSLYALWRARQAQQKGHGLTFVGLIISVLLAGQTAFMSSLSVTIFKTSAYARMLSGYQPLSSGDTLILALYPIIAYVHFVGWVLLAFGTWGFYDGYKYQERGWLLGAFTTCFFAAVFTNAGVAVNYLSNSFNLGPVDQQYFDFEYETRSN